MRIPPAEMAAARDRLGPLLRIAQSGLDRLFSAVGGVGCSVLLADGEGVVLDRRGARSDDTTFRRLGAIDWRCLEWEVRRRERHWHLSV
jgi:transcriptional regulator of acetoin/glycerol metabolism